MDFSSFDVILSGRQAAKDLAPIGVNSVERSYKATPHRGTPREILHLAEARVRMTSFDSDFLKSLCVSVIWTLPDSCEKRAESSRC